jgi:hypothetical protein
MDKRIRKNEICVIGQPRCDFVFSSTRTCFISYGFKESPLETAILRQLLEARGIEPVEAGAMLTPAQNVFCAKICSKIITSQFCVVLANNRVQSDRELPNPNVYLEYGLMLGFNKYIVPFQKDEQTLAFNVAGFDTVKYAPGDFEQRAAAAIDQAIQATRQESLPPLDTDQTLDAFLLARRAIPSPIVHEQEAHLHNLGNPLGFKVYSDFQGFTLIYVGIFTALRPEAVVWRLRTLAEIVSERRRSLPAKITLGIVTPQKGALADAIMQQFQTWVFVTSEKDKQAIGEALMKNPPGYKYQVFSLNEVQSELQKLDLGESTT